MTSDHHSLSGAGNRRSPAPSSRFKFDLNEYVWFKPIHGRAERYIADRAERIASRLVKPGVSHKYLTELYMETLDRDENGWCRWQAWRFIQVFGESMQIGTMPVVEIEVEFEHAK